MAIKTPYAFTLDFVDITKIPYMEFYQTDVNTSQMDITITNGGSKVDLTGHTIVCNIKKSDNTEIQNLTTIANATEGLINLSLSIQSLTAIGENTVQLTIFEGTNRKSTHEFKYRVKASLLNTEVPISSNEYGLLLQLIEDVQEVENILNTSEAERVQAENNRVEAENNREILKGQMDTLKTNLESLQTTLNSLNSTLNSHEETRENNETNRETLKGQLETLQTNLTTLKGQLETLNTNVSDNETTRQSQEADRQALKGQLEALQDTLEALESTLNTNDTTRNTTFNTKVSEVNNKITEATNSITDIENRFALLTTSQQQASEVINARTSTTKNKTFTDLDGRIEEVEQNILTSQATNVVDNVASVNHLTNSLDGATDLGIKGQSLVNLLGNQGTQEVTLVSNGTRIKTYDINLKANQKHALFVNITEYTASANGLVGLQAYAINIDDTTTFFPFTITQKGNSKVVITPAKDVKSLKLYLNLDTEVDTVKYKEVMLLEGDYTNIDINSYFEGIGSVEGGVIKSVSENIFDKSKITTGKILSIGNGTLSDNSPWFVTDYIPVKKGETINKGAYQQPFDIYYACEYSYNKNFIRQAVYSGDVITIQNDGFIRISGKLDKIDIGMINRGTTPKACSAYKESKITLSEYLLPEHFPLRSIGGVSDEYVGKKLYKRIKEYILQVSDITYDSSYSPTYVSVDYYKILKPVDGKYTNVAIAKAFLFDIYPEFTDSSYDDAKHIGQFASNMTTNTIMVGFAKGTTLAQAQAQLTGKKLIYQLATPTEIQLDRKINLPIFKNGSIIQEPTKLYPKLSYSFPLNISTSVEGIVNNLAWIKDNQQFIMSYLLNLDTRLTLGGH